MTSLARVCKHIRPGALAVALACSLALVCSCLPGCASQGTTAPNSSSTVHVANFHDTDIGTGWKSTGQLQLKYATGFTVDYFDGGYKLACLSDGGRYLVVPKGADVPTGLDSDVVVIRQPLRDVYLVASDSMCLFDALDALDVVTVSGLPRKEWSVKGAADAMAEGAMVYGGKYNAPDYDLLLSKGVKLAIESTMINHAPEVKDKLVELGIPVLTEQSSYEENPLGRTEWVKLYGALLDREDEAERVFDAQEKQVDAVKGASTGKTVAFFYINSNGAAVVRRPGDYVTRMIEMAGGSYIFKSLGGDQSATSTVTLEMEKFYATAKDADYIFYNTSIEGRIYSVDELVAKNQLLADFKAVRDGNVWCTDQNMYQQMINTGDIISDFNEVLSGTDKSRLGYLYKIS